MSASNKKKLRKELNAAAMTEKQKKEQQEAKKLKAYTLTFAIVMVLVIAIVVGVVVTPLIDGAIRRGSQAVTIGDHKVSTAELTYFYFDAINEHQQDVYDQYYNQFGEYWAIMLGFDTAKSLNEQTYDKESGKTWAEYFMDTAIENARDAYALYDDAVAKGHKLTEDEQSNLDSYLDSLDMYATYYGYSNVKSYLRSNYGNGATEDGYRDYYSLCTMASSYMDKYADGLEYKDADFRAYEKDKYENYSTFSYVHYTMKYNSYLGEGKKDDSGVTTWTEDEKEAARTALKADMQAILAGEVKDKESFDKAIQSLAINKTDADGNPIADDKKPTATEVKRQFFENIILHAGAVEWLTEEGRNPGDFKAFEVYTYAEHEDPEHEHGDECGCARTVDGYTIVLFNERDDNTRKMANVRHILVEFEGGTKGENGTWTYSETEKAAAKAEAEKLLKQWQDGKANEESFGELANAESDDNNGNVTNGGLYEDIYPGQMVENFENWCFEEGRKPGDTGIVETEYGYHVMYYSSTDEMSYRDLLIDADLRTEDTEKWHDGLVEKMPFEIISLDKMDYDYVIEG